MSPTCTSCASGYTLSNGKCVANAATCSVGYYLKNGVCTACASGTFGSLAALPFAWVIVRYWGEHVLLISAIAVYFISVWAADVIMKKTHTQDPGLIVIDEVAGQ